MPHIIVTGASRGIGMAIARRLYRDGASVTTISRGDAGLEAGVEAEAGAGAEGRGGALGSARHRKADLADVDGVEALVEEIDAEEPVDGVVHAAGVQLRKPALQLTGADLELLLRLHVSAPMLMSSAIARRQIEAGRAGSHVMIGSLGSAIAIPGAAAYTVAKTALMGAVRALATELAPRGIRVNAVNPGYFATELTADLLADPAQRTRIIARIPAQRLGDVDEVAGAAAFLLGDDSSYITGESLRVDGGWLAA